MGVFPAKYFAPSAPLQRHASLAGNHPDNRQRLTGLQAEQLYKADKFFLAQRLPFPGEPTPQP
jgi:hypothetical protein